MSYMSERSIDKQNAEPARVAMVTIRHKGKLIDVEVNKCEFLGIEEDIHGRDLLTFKYEGVRYNAHPWEKWK